jgi:hypothetical protein
MVEVYYYLPLDKVNHAVECGMKLSGWFDKEVVIRGESKRCISALLNPKDDMEKYRSDTLKGVKIEIPPYYCFVADKYLYQAGLNFPEVMELYTRSITPIQDYIFGSFRLPECLITCTVIAGQVSVLDKRLDSPVLFGNSEELYINNIVEAYREKHQDFNDTMLYYFYCKLAENGKIEKIEDTKKKIAVFLDKTGNQTVTIKIPEISEY